MINKFKEFLSKSAYGIYGILYSIIVIMVIVKNTAFDFDISRLVPIMVAVTLFIAGILSLYTRYNSFFIRNRYKILTVFCVVLFIVQFAVTSQILPVTLYDHEKVFNGAVIYATSGQTESFEMYKEYLHHYPHQMGLFLIQQTLFKIAVAFGCTNFFMVAAVFGHLLFTVMIISSFLYLDENFNSHRALFFLVLIGLFAPLYFQGSISYTDTYSVWTASCLLLFISRAISADNIKKLIFNASVSGILISCAIQIKSTAAIVVIALMIGVFVKGLNKNHILIICVTVVFTLSTNYLFNEWKNNTIMDESYLHSKMPVTHWIMMGLQGDGSYSAYDEWNITSSVPAEQRVEKNIEVIKQRLKDMGPVGYLKLLYKKTCRTFGSGDAEVYYTFLYASDSKPINLVYEITLSNGKFFPEFRYLSQATYLIALISGISGSMFIIFKRDKNLFNFAPHIALIGFWIFMMLWESNHRQLINQWSLFFITAAVGVYYIWQFAVDKLKK